MVGNKVRIIVQNVVIIRKFKLKLLQRHTLERRGYTRAKVRHCTLPYGYEKEKLYAAILPMSDLVQDVERNTGILLHSPTRLMNMIRAMEL